MTDMKLFEETVQRLRAEMKRASLDGLNNSEIALAVQWAAREELNASSYRAAFGESCRRQYIEIIHEH